MSEPDPDGAPSSVGSGTAAPATARLTIHRTAEWDEQSRQILLSVDGTSIGQLLYGQTLSREIPAGAHTLKANNTLVWKTVPFDATAGQDVHFTVWNQPMGGWPMRLLFIFVGAAALKLGIAPGPPDASRHPGRR